MRRTSIKELKLSVGYLGRMDTQFCRIVKLKVDALFAVSFLAYLVVFHELVVPSKVKLHAVTLAPLGTNEHAASKMVHS